jgi:hypothetical protein
MKGPRSRHKFYIARLWECPVCARRVHTPVQVVNRACHCQPAGPTVWMRLLEEAPAPRKKKE